MVAINHPESSIDTLTSMKLLSSSLPFPQSQDMSGFLQKSLDSDDSDLAMALEYIFVRVALAWMLGDS